MHVTRTRAFTLIELLVVIAIIGLLSSVVLASLNTARSKGADAALVSSMLEIQKAVELYNDANNHYPNTSGAWTSFDSPTYSPNPIVSPAAANLTTALAPYIHKVTDSQTTVLGGDSGYLYFSGGDDYCILVYRIPRNMNDFKPSLIPARCGTVANGQCTASPNAIYVGTGQYASGC